MRLKLRQGALNILGQFDTLELRAVEELATVVETMFDVGLDFAIIVSSPVSSGVFFRHILKLLMLNKRRRWFHSSRVTLPFISMSASSFLVSAYLIWIFLVRVDCVKEPSKRNSVGSGHVSHCWTSAFDDHLQHRFVFFKNVRRQNEKISRLRKHHRHWIIQDHRVEFES